MQSRQPCSLHQAHKHTVHVCFLVQQWALPAPHTIAGDATLAWSFTLLGSGNSKAGNASWTIPAASITGTGTAAIPHSAVLSLTNELLRSGGLFTLQLTAALTAGSLTDSATTPTASREFGLGEWQQAGVSGCLAAYAAGNMTCYCVLLHAALGRLGATGWRLLHSLHPQPQDALTPALLLPSPPSQANRLHQPSPVPLAAKRP